MIPAEPVVIDRGQPGLCQTGEVQARSWRFIGTSGESRAQARPAKRMARCLDRAALGAWEFPGVYPSGSGRHVGSDRTTVPATWLSDADRGLPGVFPSTRMGGAVRFRRANSTSTMVAGHIIRAAALVAVTYKSGAG